MRWLLFSVVLCALVFTVYTDGDIDENGISPNINQHENVVFFYRIYYQFYSVIVQP